MSPGSRHALAMVFLGCAVVQLLVFLDDRKRGPWAVTPPVLSLVAALLWVVVAIVMFTGWSPQEPPC